MNNKIKYLLDTNICVFLLRGKKDIVKKIENIGISNCAISEITIAELFYGLECADDNNTQKELVKSFCQIINVFRISSSLIEYARQKAILRKKGMLIDDLDLLIGSTAIHNNLILVTENIKHFDRLPVSLENWVTR